MERVPIMNNAILSNTINSLQNITKIDVKDSKSVHHCIKELYDFDLYLDNLFNNELPNWSGCDLISYNTYVLKVHEVFSECIRDIKKYEGIDFYKTKCLLVTCERLVVFFMKYIEEYNNMVSVLFE